MLEDLLEKMRNAFRDGEEEQVVALVQQALKDGIAPLSLVEDYLTKVLKEIGDKFGEGELFLLDLMSAATVVVTTEARHGLTACSPILVNISAYLSILAITT